MYVIKEGIFVKDVFPNLDTSRGEQLKFLDMCRRADKKLMTKIITDYSDSPDILHFLSRNGIHFDEKMFLILTRPATKPETLAWIYRRYHAKTVINTFKSLIKPEREAVLKQIRTLIAVHPNASIEILETLLSNEDYHLEGTILRSSAFPMERKEEILVRMLKDENVRIDGSEDKELSNEERAVALEEFMQKKETEHWIGIAELPFLDLETIISLLSLGNVEVKRVLYSNRTLSPEARQILASEPDPELLALLGEVPK